MERTRAKDGNKAGAEGELAGNFSGNRLDFVSKPASTQNINLHLENPLNVDEKSAALLDICSVV